MEVKKIFSPFSQILSLMPNMMIVLYTVPDSVKNNNVVEYKYNSNKKIKKQLQHFQRKYVYIDLEKTDKVWYNYIKGTNLLTRTYTYSDVRGNHSISYSNGGGSTGAQYNPFRYRGYYYDTDLGMYYLQENTLKIIRGQITEDILYLQTIVFITYTLF